MPSVREIANGKWPGILRRLGMDEKFLHNHHGPCPICGTGKDRYRFDDRDGSGSFYCSHCGAGDGVRLVMLFKNMDFKNAASEIEAAAGFVKSSVYAEKATDDQKRKALNAVWAGAVRVEHGDPVCGYLEKRGIRIAYISPSLRFHPSLKYYREGEASVEGVFEAMLAIVTAPDGSGATIHRTYLKDGQKAPVASPKKLMQGMPIKGSAIRLFPVADVLGVAEGIETALAAAQLFGVPTWACVSAGGLESFVPPSEVKRLVIFADNDASFTGQAAAYKLANRMVVAGMEVEVRIPSEVGKDWADVV
jgi:putative DNA primase/helicase